MKYLKNVLSFIISASILSATMPVFAAEDDVMADTYVSAIADNTYLPGYDDEITDTLYLSETIPEESELAAAKAGIYSDAPGYQIDPDTGESTIDENGYITSTYGYSIHEDPFNTKQVLEGKNYSSGGTHLHDPYWLDDENFFGKWNSSSESWDIQGKLDYENYPALADVENAAKQGDYETAKLALYNYYIIIERGRNRVKDISTSKADTITADLLLKNFMYNARSGITPVELLYINNTPQYYSADITSTVSQYIGSRQSLTFWVLATDKNGDSAIFNSKEAGEDTAPYLKIKVNGTEQIVYPTDDTNIKAGSNATKVYGSDSVLTAKEDAINSPNTLVNENTSRIYLKFDVSWLKEGDTVSAATLNLYGNNEKENSDKEVVIFYSDDSNWDEKTSNYNNVLAQVVYSYDQLDSWAWNQPTAAGYRYQEELLRFDTWYDKLVKLYNFTGEEKYSYTALRLLMDYIYVRGNDIAWLKSLDVAVRSQCIPDLTMQIIESAYMTPDIFTAFLKYMYVEANGAQYFTTTGNWGTSECQGLYSIAATFPEFKDSQQWINRVKSRYESLSNALINSDLTSTELAIGYVDYAISTLTGAKDIADSLGITDYPYTEKTLENIKNMGLFMYYSSLPGVSDNQVGDGYSHRGNFKSRMQYLAKWFDDPHLKYAAGLGGEEPDFTSHIYPVGLKAVMRTGWDDKAWYLFTDADGGFGNHAHPDDNSIVIMADGQYLLVDPLYGSYSGSSSRYWLISTLAHNTVTMNGKNQYTNSSSAGKGSIDRWETNNTYDFITTNTPNTPDASSYKRSILFVRDKFWLVNDYLVPKNNNSNKYVQSWHFLPEANISMEDGTDITRTNIEGVNIQVVPVNPDEYTSSEIKTGYYSEGQGSVSDAKYTEYEQNLTGNAVFNTILIPESIGENYEVTAVETTVEGMDKTDASAYEIYIKDKNTQEIEHYVYYLLHDVSKKRTVTVGGLTTDATMMLAMLDTTGNVTQIAIQDSTYIKKDSAVIYSSNDELSELSIKINGQICEIDGSNITEDELISNNLKVYVPRNDIKKVTLNGNSVDFTYVNDYIYFGESPTPDPNQTPVPKPTSTPSHGSSSSGGGGGGGGGISIKPTATPTPSVTPSPTAVPTDEPMPTEKPVYELSSSMEKELENHWAKSEITALYNDGIVTGISDTSLGLDNPITRAEFVTLMVRALGLDINKYDNSFSDVNKDDWYADYIQTAYDNKLISGFDDMMLPNSYITREEMAVILNNALKDSDIELKDLSFIDKDSISDWAENSVKNVVSAGIMNGMDDGSFAPKNNTKRSEAFVVIYRLINL